MNLNEIPTPALILDKNVLIRNCSYMAERLKNHKINLRPHLKTAKSIKVAEIATKDHFGGITVSTLAEARYFVSNGVKFRYSDGAWNSSSNTYIYMAFAEQPFVTSGGVPCTAR